MCLYCYITVTVLSMSLLSYILTFYSILQSYSYAAPLIYPFICTHSATTQQKNPECDGIFVPDILPGLFSI